VFEQIKLDPEGDEEINTGLSWLRMVPSCGIFEHDNDLPASDSWVEGDS